MSKKAKSSKKGFLERARESAAQQQALAERKKAAQQKQAPSPSPPAEKTPEEKRQQHIDGIKKTVLPAIIGTAAGVISKVQLNDGSGIPWLSMILFVIIFSYYAQRIIYPLIGVDVKEFGNKDWFYVEFITIDFWLVVWTLLLNPPPL